MEKEIPSGQILGTFLPQKVFETVNDVSSDNVHDVDPA